MPKLRSALVDKIRFDSDEVDVGSSEPSEELTEIAGMLDAIKAVGEVKYLVKDWIPYGMLTGIVAEPGIGKSAFALGALAKTVATGCRWFNHYAGPKPGYVLWCPTENDLAITLKRMKDWDVPFDKILLPLPDALQAINLTDQSHLRRVEQIINKQKVRLVVVDSLRGGHADDENSSKVGHIMKSLSSLAERTGTALVVVHHIKKLMIDEEVTANSSRVSNAIVAMMRSMIGIDRPDKNSEWCRMRVLKENLGIAPKPIGFRVTAEGLEFGDAPQKPVRTTVLDKTAEWLKERLKSGKEYRVSDVESEAEAIGLSVKTLRKCLAEVGVESTPVRKDGRLSYWTWRLPKDDSE